jgi:hypothetical protein
VTLESGVMWLLRIVAVAAVALILAPHRASAKLGLVPLEQLVREADLIVVGRAVSTEDVDVRGPWGAKGRISRIDVERVVSGADGARSISVLTFPQYEDTGILKAETRELLFLVKCGEWYEPVIGLRGTYEIDKDGLVQSYGWEQWMAVKLKEAERKIHTLATRQRRVARSPLSDVCMSMWHF